MEDIKKQVWEYAKDSKLSEIVERSKSYANNNSSEGKGFAAFGNNETQILLTRTSRGMVSWVTCSKLCGVFFIGGVVFGYTLKNRVRRWASKALKWIKDD